MEIADNNLAELLKLLNDRERRALDQALKGDRTATAATILRWIRRRLKGKARAGKGPRPEPKRKYRRLRRPGAKTAQKDAITRKKEE